VGTSETQLLLNLGFIVVGAGVFAFIGKLIRMPSIVAYIVAGMVLGPVLHIVEVGDSLKLISKLGIALLLFLVGLELSFDKIRDVGRVALVAGLGQVVFTALGGMALCLVLGFDLVSSLFLSIGLTFSSTVVVVKLLDQKGDLGRLYGRIAVGIFLVQDLVVIAVLTLLSGLEPGGDLNWINVAQDLGIASGSMLLLLGVTLLASKYLLPKPFAWAARSPDTIFIWALFWCFLITSLAGFMGLSVEVGAFLAGIALAQLPYNTDLHQRLHPLMTFFVAIFFATLGVTLDLSAALDNWKASLILSLFVIIGNPLIFMIIISRMGYAEVTAFRASVTVAQISEFSFIFATLGLSAGLIGHEILSITALVGIVTIAVSAYMIIYTEPLYRFCRRIGLLRIFRAKQEPDIEKTGSRSDHVIVVGMNALGREIVQTMTARGERVLAIDTDPEKLTDLAPAEIVIGNVEYESVIEEIGLPHAKLVVSALRIEDANLLLAYRCRARGIPCAIHAFDVSIVDDLLELGTSYLLMPSVENVISQREAMAVAGIIDKNKTNRRRQQP
jgi:Kef-type K+ transport system membrane component KefB